MKVLKVLFSLLLCVSISVTVFADDNATSGSGDTNSAVTGRGFYRGSEYMYKVSVYVGLTDNVNTNSNMVNFNMIGNFPVYVKPSHFSLPENLTYGIYSKVDYLNKVSLIPANNAKILIDNPPPPPITNDGNINSVKSYFGDVNTLDMLINVFAEQKGTTREGLVSNIEFTINGVKRTYPSRDILPEKVGDTYTNKVPWVIIYEPVIISYLKDGFTTLAFTATEYALAQKLGYFNFKFGDDGQYISGMTHSDLPNSIVLEESWFGYPVTPAFPDNVYWSEDRIIQGGGWGMRMLRANGTNATENDITFDYEYRVGTDVITSVTIHTDSKITSNNMAYVTMNANGQSATKAVVLPSGGSQLVWLKWHTPKTPQEVNISTSISGNSSAYLDSGARTLTVRANVVDLNERIPPNPTYYDRKPVGFSIPSVPVSAQNTSATWGEWNCYWKTNWVKVGNGKWVDQGDWRYEWTSYQANLSASMTVKPDSKVPTASGNTIKSGYGINLEVSTNLSSNALASQITGAQNVISYYPEFNYNTYCRVSDMVTDGYNAKFELKPNNYSAYSRRVHFTPLWYPDGRYIPQARVIDVWTPAGMLTCSLENYVNINDSVYDDYHIGPK